MLEPQAADCRDAASGELARWWEPVAQLNAGLVRMPDESSCTDVEAEVGVQLPFWRAEDVQPVHWEISVGGVGESYGAWQEGCGIGRGD